ncbi:MAG: lysostaphin resistance A-like protein [Gemmatimonadota bacterium]
MRRLGVWMVAGLLVGACGWYAHLVFPQAFPLVELDLQMDREAALEAALDLAGREGWETDGFRQAASFGQANPRLQSYVELEHGGATAFRELIRSGIHHPYSWEVRHFLPGEALEVRVRFSPSGEPLGFRLRTSEDDPGASLNPAQAQALAEEQASERWGFRSGEYRLVESSQVLRTSGRGDHTFVYQRPGVRVGDAPVRLRLGVAGERLAEVSPEIPVPEAFQRRYEELRSGNDAVALGATLVFLIIFLLVGCGLGALLLYRHGRLERGRALGWGLVVAGLLAAALLNGLPLAWMGYDTALSSQWFVLQYVLGAGLVILFGAPALALIFMTAEGLGRWAFPGQLQFWRLWSPGVGNSLPVVVRTLVGYGLVPLQLAFVVAFYRLAGGRPGWWIPSDTLLQPDLLASYAPWVTAVALALQAGFWEESVFRAIPLAGAVLLGRRFGRPAVWVVATLLLQAFVFAGAHANYPQQPAYARVAELLVPSLVWGLVYLRLGLLPILLSHFLYNLTWLSTPLFVASASGLWIDRVLVVVAGLVPLGVVLVRGSQLGWRTEPAVGSWNREWRPSAGMGGIAGGSPPGAPAAASGPGSGGRLLVVPHPPGWVGAISLTSWRRGAGALILLGLGWLFWGPMPAKVTPPLEHTREQAVERAWAEVESRAGPLPEGYSALAWVDGVAGQDLRFVWETRGPEAVEALLGSYLQPPHWHVRLVRLRGSPEERAREYEVELAAHGGLYRFRRRIPEEAPGPDWSQTEARDAAHAALSHEFSVAPSELEEVSAVSHRRPHRTDWTFRYRWEEGVATDDLEGEFTVVIAGEGTSDVLRYVRVPEAWERADRSRRNRILFVGVLSSLMALVALGGGVVAAGLRWARGRLASAPARKGGTAALVLLGLQAWNGWPAELMNLSTSRPLAPQLFANGAGVVLGVALLAAALSLLLGLVRSWLDEMASFPWLGQASRRRASTGLMVGVAAGIWLGLALCWGATALPGGGPSWPPLWGVDGRSAAAGAALAGGVAYLGGLTVLLFLLTALVRWTAAQDSGQGRWPSGGVQRTSALLVLMGLAAAGATAAHGPVSWLLAGAGMALALHLTWWVFLRWGPGTVVTGWAAVLMAARGELLTAPPFPGAWAGAVMTLGVVGVLAWGALSWLELIPDSRRGAYSALSASGPEAREAGGPGSG